MMKAKDKFILDQKLDEEEIDLLESFERGEWKSVKDPEGEMAFAKAAAANHFKKDEPITVKVSRHDLFHLKRQAANKGLDWKDFVAGFLHELAAGHFKESR